MRPMTSKRVKWLLWTGAIAIVLVAIGLAVMLAALPTYVETRLVPKLSKDLGVKTGEVRIRRIGLWGADLGPIQLLGDRAPAITIATVQIDYSPLSLVRGNIKGITIGGLDLKAAVTRQGFTIEGFPVSTPKKETSGKDRPTIHLDALLPIGLTHLSVHQSHLIIHQGDRRHVVPFDIQLQTHQLDKGILKGSVQLTLFGNPVALNAAIDQKANQVNIGLNTKRFSVQSLSQLEKALPHLQATGRLDLEAKASLTLEPMALTDLAASGQLSDTTIAGSGWTIENQAIPPSQSLPIDFTVSGQSLSDLQWRCEPILITTPVEMAVKQWHGHFSYSKRQWSLKGAMETLIPRQKVFNDAAIEKDLSIGLQMTAQGHAPGNDLVFEIASQKGAEITAAINGIRVSGQADDLAIKGRFQNTSLVAEGRLAAVGLGVELTEGNITAPKLQVDGTLVIHPSGSEKPSKATARAALSKVRSKTGAATVTIPKVSVTASAEQGPQKTWLLNSRLNFSNGRMRERNLGLSLKNLHLDLPLQWPYNGKIAAGRIRVGAMQWHKHSLGGLRGNLRQKQNGFTMNLGHSSKLFPGMRVLINARLDKDGTAFMRAEIPPHHQAEEIDMGRFSPDAAGVMFSGHLQGAGKATIGKTGITGTARLTLNQGRLNRPSQDLLLDGIDMDLTINDIAHIKSAPQQKLTVDRLAFGNLKAKNLDLEFQLEEHKTLFIEKAQIDWSEGRVYTAAIRINPEVEDYDVILFCDRLNLAMLLEQLGAAEASGAGTVNGRIPIHWSNKRISFDNGFLYSTPGQTGAIQLSGTQTLLQGLPPGTPQHTQLDIATEALKDYTYKWAKLNVQTDADTLLLKLQFDGKPNRLLPFAYDKSLGQFKRVAGEGQADFKGISIDLNFRSPLNDIINYRELIK